MLLKDELEIQPAMFQDSSMSSGFQGTDMKKISIARRRIETTNQNSFRNTGETDEGKTLLFRRRGLSGTVTPDTAETGRPCGKVGGGDGLMEVDLPPSRKTEMDSLLAHEPEARVNATLKKQAGGVLFLKIEPLSNKTPRYMSARTIAGILEISTKTVYRLHKRGRLPAVRIGRNLRFEFGSVLNYLEACAEGSGG